MEEFDWGDPRQLPRCSCICSCKMTTAHGTCLDCRSRCQKAYAIGQRDLFERIWNAANKGGKNVDQGLLDLFKELNAIRVEIENRIKTLFL